jgi:hypothetical protein
LKTYKAATSSVFGEEFDRLKENVHLLLSSFFSSEVETEVFLNDYSIFLARSKIGAMIDRKNATLASGDNKRVDPQVVDMLHSAYEGMRDSQFLELYEKYIYGQDVECDGLDSIQIKLCSLASNSRVPKDKSHLYVMPFRKLGLRDRVSKLMKDLIYKLEDSETYFKDGKEARAYADFMRDVMFEDSDETNQQILTDFLKGMISNDLFMGILFDYDNEDIFLDALFASFIEKVGSQALDAEGSGITLECFKEKIGKMNERNRVIYV